MSFTILGTGAFFAVCLVIYRFFLLPAFLSPLAKVPNAHWTSPFSTVWTEKRWRGNANNDRSLAKLLSAHQRQGEIVRLGPKNVSVASLEGIRQVYTYGLEKDGCYAEEPVIHEQFGHPPMISLLDKESHSIRKRIVSGIYAKSFLMNSHDLAASTGMILKERLLPRLEAAAVAPKQRPVNVLPLYKFAGADLLSAYQLGTANSTNYLENKEARDIYFGTTELGDWASNKKNGSQLFLRQCRAAFAMLGQEPPGATQPVVMAKLYQGLKNSKSTHFASEEELFKACASELLDHQLAAHEGTGFTMTYMLWELSRRPDLQYRLRGELETLNPRMPSAESDQELPSLASIDSLPFLHAILYETLRAHTVLAGEQPRIVKASGIELHGCFIPEGTRISANAYTLHRNAEAFPEASTWAPERWMPDAEGQVDKALMRWFWAFGSGGRMCIGSHVAVNMLKVLLATLYANYTTTIVEEKGMGQTEATFADPMCNKLTLRLHKVD